MMLAGISIDDRLVLELARRVRDAGFDDTAQRLEDAYDGETKILGLSVSDREGIVRALEDCPDDFAELRGVLLRDHEWRLRRGL